MIENIVKLAESVEDEVIGYRRDLHQIPEISYEQIDKIRGMDIIICTTAQTDEEARELLTIMGAPFAK